MTSAKAHSMTNLQHVLQRMAARQWAWRPVVIQACSDGAVIILVWDSIASAQDAASIEDATYEALASANDDASIDAALDKISMQMSDAGHDPTVGPSNGPGA